MNATKVLRHRHLAGIALLLIAGCAAQPSVSPDRLQHIRALQQQIDALERQAQRLEDASAIKRLQRAYGYYVDQAQWDQVADLFATHGTIEIALDGVYIGRERVRAYLLALGGGRIGLKQGQLNEHLQLQPYVTVAENGLTAKARWRAWIMAGQAGERAVWGEGPYENEYVKEDGVWKISRLHWYQTFLVPYEGGWAKNRDVNGGHFVSSPLVPDSPSTERYGTWPDVYTPPYHYRNPVTGR
jgi:hypothetical protein